MKLERIAIVVLVALIGVYLYVDLSGVGPALYRDEKVCVMRNGDVKYHLDRQLDADPLVTALNVLRANGVRPNRLYIEMNSPGGAVFEALYIISLMRQFQHTQALAHGIAGSGGMLVFVNAHTRLMSEDAYLMWHSIQISPLATLNQEQKEFITRLQHHLNSMIMKKACRGEQYFDIPFQSTREVWLRRDLARHMCLAD